LADQVGCQWRARARREQQCYRGQVLERRKVRDGPNIRTAIARSKPSVCLAELWVRPTSCSPVVLVAFANSSRLSAPRS
jgi:hypothetical protein